MATATPTSERQAFPFLNDPIESVTGKGIVVTGGTTGIGRATALLLAAHGARVLIFGRTQQHLDDALRDVKSLGGIGYGITADLSRPEEIKRVFEEADRQLQRVDILVNNAALPADSVVKDTQYADWEYVIHTNVLGYIGCAREAADRMRRNGGGHIVNIGSLSAKVHEKGSSLYVTTKSAIAGFSESLAKELMDDDIKVTLIEPGSVGSDMVEPSPEEQARQQAEGKMLKAEDIAWCVYYCLTQPKRCDVMHVRIRPHKQEIC